MNKTYPYGPPKSRETFPNRLSPQLVEGKVMITTDREIWGESLENRSLSDFLLDRIADYDQALTIAEQQISDMQVEYPFLPEDFGFTVIPKDEGAAKTIYRNKTHMISRVNDDLWYISNIGPVRIENAAVGQTVLLALGIIPKEELSTAISISTKPELSDKERSNLLHQIAVDLSECDELLENPEIDGEVRDGVMKRKDQLQTEYQNLLK